MTQSPSFDFAVIGGGLAGLSAALFAARAGKSVILLERAPELGGRAVTQNRHGFLFNQGPHALYRAGQGASVLRELGIEWKGAAPAPEGSWALYQGRKYLLPRTPAALQESELLSAGAAAETGRLFSELNPACDLEPWQDRSWREWLETQVEHPETRALLGGLMRLSTYCNDDARQSAGAALAQFIMGAAGVEYLDGGWQSLVDALGRRAEEVGVKVEIRSRIVAIHSGEENEIVLQDGGRICARSVIATVAPATLASLIYGGANETLQGWARAAVPIHAACLDVGMRRILNPENQFAIGLDRPLYYSVHTRSARLAPEGGALIQVAKYLPTGSEKPADEMERELEGLMDELQPGWRAEVVARRYLPRMIVAHAVVSATAGGTAGRPGPNVPGLPSLFVAGDWVGAHGMLADASLASARSAAALALESLERDERREFAIAE